MRVSSNLISQAPEKPGSTFSLLVIVFGALLGHILLSALFVVQAWLCRWIDQCLALPFDPNVYRVTLTNGRSAGLPSDAAFLCWFVRCCCPDLSSGWSPITRAAGLGCAIYARPPSSAGSRPDPLIQLEAGNFVNVALEVFEGVDAIAEAEGLDTDP